MLCRRVFLQSAAASIALARPAQQKADVAVASASRDETARVAIVLSSFAGSSDHDGTPVKGLADPQPVTKDLTDAQIDAMVRKALDLDNSRGGGLRGIAEAEDWIVVYGIGPDVRVVRSIIAFLLDHKCGARITAALGSDGRTTDRGGASGGASYRQLTADFAKMHPAVQFDFVDVSLDGTVESPAPANQAHTYHVSKTIQQCDKLISVAPLRTDRKAGVSLSIMNYRGIAPNGFSTGEPEEVAVDLFSFHPADYAVVGGSWGIEGDGESVHHNVVIAGANAVAVDAVSAAVMGFDPSAIRHLRLAERKGFGGWDTDVVWTRGNEIEAARRRFKRSQ